jgi:long-chain fatty acid transport protein
MRKLALLVLALAPVASLANGYSLPNVNPRDLAMNSALTAAQRDAAATHANPAALSKLEGLNLSLGLTYLDLRTDWTSPDGSMDASMNYNPVTPVALFAAWGGKFMGRGWGVGVGMTNTHGGAVNWDEDWEGRYRVITVDRRVYELLLTGGVEVLPWLRLGGGAIYYRTTEELSQKIDALTQDVEADLTTAGGALSFDLSAEIAVPGLPLTFGVDYKHQAVQKLEGDAHFSNVPPELAQSLPDQAVEHVLTIPNTLNVGVAWKPIPSVLVTGVYTWERYSVYTEDRFSGDMGTEVVVPRDYDDGYTLRFGAEWQATPKLQVRGGFQRDVSGQKTDNYSPSLPDGSSWGIGLGGGWAFSDRLTANLGLFYAIFDDVEVTGTEAFLGTFEPSAFFAGLNAVWRPEL